MKTQATKPNRRLNIAIGMSLLACITTIGAWAFSVLCMWLPLGNEKPGQNFYAAVYCGKIGVVDSRKNATHSHGAPVIVPPFTYFGFEPINGVTMDERLGLAWPELPEKKRYPQQKFVVYRFPLWVAVAPCVLITTVLLILNRLQSRRPLAGSCRRCRYDLTGNQSGTCPECGLECDVTVEGVLEPTHIT